MARLGLISPILVGPCSRIEAVARQHAIYVTGLPIVDATKLPPSRRSRIVREGKAEALMKGSLHTDELMGAVVRRDTGLARAQIR